MSTIAAEQTEATGYVLRISRLTVDKLGVKLYDKASAVVAELVANAWDADATEVLVRIPLGTELARKGEEQDRGYVIEVKDNGHGMTPEEAQRDYLEVGRDRREHPEQGAKSRERERPVMGRKGIGKLAPFGICKVIEVISSGGKKTAQGYLTTHFTMRFDDIVKDSDEPVPLKSGELDGTYQPERGTTIRLSDFRPRRVPDRETFFRQLGRRFALADKTDFSVYVENTRVAGAERELVPHLDVEVLEHTRLDLAPYPIELKDDEDEVVQELPVTGWLALAKEAYKNEEMTGVRIYARGKIVATTRDFEQPAGYTSEFTIRSYLVGELHAEWLDEDEGEDLIRTDRQDILWDSELGDALREWGKERIRQLGTLAKQPRRDRVRKSFLERSQIAARAEDRFTDKAIVDAAIELAQQIGGFAAEDELEDEEFVADLTDVILSVAPHRALIDAFQEFSQLTLESDEPPPLESLVDLFSKTRVAELASYSQIAAERVRVIQELEKLLYEQTSDESALQRILTEGPWLIEPTWTVISQNQGLLTFKRAFEKFWKQRTGEEVELAIEYGKKRPDFVLVSVGGMLHIVEIKAPGHAFDDIDFKRMHNYAEAFTEFAEKNKDLMASFPEGWRIDLVADDVAIKDDIARRAYRQLEENGLLKQMSWNDFAYRARHAHEEFLTVQAKIRNFLEDNGADDAAA
jgi:hypothetical protein